ncbi:MAG: DUF4911 domain-containing protein [Desulfovibrio sp.]|uniref:DUF4911 domain-containing protein n=1 Tax=Desulfovibrio sp. TaxID=885 RepID=UPI001A66FAFA|nr:DUF4911 domain-containing protein [Desulfovibrio sp.]MBD5417717.1 DUF4911 domain-containing protein [Desulfovibrio sp.]
MSPRPCAPPPRHSARLLVRLAPADVALFRFLLEAYENLAFFTVLERKTALLKVVFSPQQEDAVRAALAEIGASVPLTVRDWPFGRPDN